MSYCFMEVCAEKGAYESKREELYTLFTYCFLDLNELFFVPFSMLDPVNISPLSIGLLLAFINREFWRDIARP